MSVRPLGPDLGFVLTPQPVGHHAESPADGGVGGVPHELAGAAPGRAQLVAPTGRLVALSDFKALAGLGRAEQLGQVHLVKGAVDLDVAHVVVAGPLQETFELLVARVGLQGLVQGLGRLFIVLGAEVGLP